MKILILGIMLSSSVLAAPVTGLYIKEGRSLLNVEKLINDGSDIQAEYGFEAFCYQGQANAVMTQIRRLKRAGNFFSGGGGGHELKSLTLIRGFVTYDIALRFEDEVVPGEFTSVHVKPCR